MKFTQRALYLFIQFLKVIIDGLMSVWIFIQLGGPSWKVPLGRRDSTTASLTTANSNLPLGSSNLSALISNFANQGLSTKDLVALSGYVQSLYFSIHTVPLNLYSNTSITCMENLVIATSFAQKAFQQLPIVHVKQFAVLFVNH